MKNRIDRNMGIPIYLQLKAWLEGAIERGELLAGKRIPSENELSRRHGVHRNTVRNTLSRLEMEGMVYSIPGSGWFVKPGEKKLRQVGMINMTKPDAAPLPYYSEFSGRLNRGIEEGTARYGFELHSMGRDKVELLLSGEKLDFKPEALVWLNFSLDDLLILEALKKLNIPLLLANRQIFGETIPSVTIDQYYSTRNLVSRLTRYGHRRIGCITYDVPLCYVSERFRGYCDALAEIGVEPARKLICKINNPNSARRKIRNFLKNTPDMTGLFIAGEAFHQYTFDILKKQNRKIPEDLSVVTFDRVAGNPEKIIALDQPLEELGRRIFRTLDIMFSGKQVTGEILKPQITHGNSIKLLKPTLNPHTSNIDTKSKNEIWMMNQHNVFFG